MTDIDDDLTAVVPGSLMERLGISLLEVSAERAVGTMPVHGNTQPLRLLHGGATAALAETLGSYAAYVHAGPNRTAVGVDLSITHHRAVREGLVTATATALHLGGRVCSYSIDVVDDKGRKVASARLTCMLLAHPQDS
ncbi:PaaI family thioesterase [Demequina salsinemoris]|uniref:PaaI family thioesterase n=1 Tax=Demequina salsinemoris TaxID=577470 RepID=UPI000785229E|nr:PaaI family thioesterase [Demequina salsinemoris]